MKIAEALIHKSDLEEKIRNLYSRADENLLVQEGEEVQEDSKALVEAMKKAGKDLVVLTSKIQGANSSNKLRDEDGKEMEMTIQEALVYKDGLISLSSKLRSLASDAVPQTRYSQSEIKIIPTVDAKALQAEADDLAKEARDLDIAIQRTNWLVEI